MIRVDAVELDEGEERVLELLVDWIGSPAASPETTDPDRQVGSYRS
jgi:hypothetical protein